MGKGEYITYLQMLGIEPNQLSPPSACLWGSNTRGRLNLSSGLSLNPYRLLFFDLSRY